MEGLQAISRPGSQTVHHRSALLYGLVIIQLQRRHLVWINVTANPTAERIAHQITEAFPGIRHPDTSSGTETLRTAMP